MHRKFRRTKKRFVITRRKRVRKLKLLARHPVVLPVVTFLVLAVLTTIGILLIGGASKVTASNAFVVIVSHDHVQQTVPTHEPNVGALLQKLHITLREGDVVEPSLATPINQDDFRINVYRSVPVEIVDGEQKTYTFSAATTPRSIAQQAGVTLNPEDDLGTLPTTNFLQEDAIGERVVIDRATPVHVNLYGTKVDMYTHAKTVGDLLKEKGITLAAHDSLQPSADTPIISNQLIFILRKGVKITSSTKTIPMPVREQYSADLAFGEQAVRQRGSPGKRVITYQVQLRNGKEVSRKVIQSVIVQPAVAQIVVVGTSLSGIKGDMALAGISPNDYQYADYIISHESGWCPTKAQGEYGSCPAYTGYVPSYGGYGLCQATPGIKMESAGSDWATNPVTQLRWCSGYATGRYGSWQSAYYHWVNYHYW
jgi:resuscitation-promoting factor RpfB